MATPTDELELRAAGARRIHTDTDPDELVLPEASAQRLRRIAQWLVQPPPVLREWGLHRFIDGGLRALFRGPSGTGKTVAAVAIGRWTERPVFHVDLGAIVSKYIGETEKNLDRIFEAANEEGAILFFDEADSLFGKRSEVRDSHDRYANIEIAYLLRRIEPFEGLAIIASNGRRDLDDDAVTRLDGIVDFPMPDEAAREQLWRRTLGSVKLPQKVADSDIRQLAKQYALSGAEILRSVRIAALLAASDNRPLDLEMLEHSAAERLAMREPPAVN
jgi:SpoVK/Ycf46/Vps4 family AAA+-type ATPase